MIYSGAKRIERGYYFIIFKQDTLKKDLWLEDQVVYAASFKEAAQLYVEVFYQPYDSIHSITESENEEYIANIKGADNYECKIKIKPHKELDLEIPAYLRY